MAVASLVLSILWIGGLGSLLAVIFGWVARRRIRESGGRETGDGLATAGLVIGIVGIAGALLLWVLIAVGVHRFNQDISPTTSEVSIGQAVTFPSNAFSEPEGISSMTVQSLKYPVTPSPTAIPPESGHEYAVAAVRVCAGRGGIQSSLVPVEFQLLLPGGQTVAPLPFDAVTPGLDQINGLGADQCGIGYVTFDITTGSVPRGVEYGLLFPNRTYLWTS
jgi:hypothetical protein